MEERIKQLMASTFGVDVGQIGNETSPNTLQNWDSLKQMQLVLSLEEEFGVEFTDDQVVDLLSYNQICNAIKELM